MDEQISILVRNLEPDYIIKNGYKGAQICQTVANSSKITDAIRMTRSKNMNVGYHLPIYYQSNPKDTYYMSKNFRLRNANFEILEANLKMIKGLKVDYVVIHFLSTQIENEKYDNLEDFINIAKKSLNRLNILAKEYCVKINIEYSSQILEYSSPKYWIDLVSGYEGLGLCLDLGELYFRSKERNRDFFKELQLMLKKVNIIHLYNAIDRQDVEKFGYIPINPSQKNEDGWIDIEKVVKYIKLEERKIPIILDPNFEYKGEEYFRDGATWLNSMLIAGKEDKYGL